MIRIAIAAAALVGIAACSVLPAPDQQAVAADAARIQGDIVKACTASGLFKTTDGLLTAAIPAASLPVAVLNAGVDKVCANPALYAQDAGTVAWVAKNLADIMAAQAAAQR